MKLTPILFEWVLTSAFLILAVLALRWALGKRVSAGLRYALWAVVLVRLLVPVQLFTTPVTGTSVMRETGVEQFVAPPPVNLEPAPVPSFDLPALTELPDGIILNYQPAPSNITVKVEPLPILQVLGWLWLAGSLTMAAALLVSNAGFARRLRRLRVPLEDADCPLPVYLADNLPSPCLFGLARPAVYVTADAAQDPAMLRHILAHERTHFRHGDHVWNVLRSAALAVHWWNPLVWLAVVLSRRDCELACDEGALKRLGDGERVAYGRTLLALITVKPRPGDLLRCATTMTGGQKSVFDRVTRIARAPKRWLWAAVVAVIATALACVCAFGQAEESDTPPASGLTADLTFSLDESYSERPVVRMDGTVDDMELIRGAFWYPETVWREDGSSQLSLLYPDFTDSIAGHVDAWWANGDRTSVTMSTKMSAMLSSLFNVGYWEFTVDLNRGAVTQMDGLSFREGFPDSETRFYPASISEEEAVRVARIAAKLLTEAENYYNNYTVDPPALYTALLGGAPFYSVNTEKTLTFDTIAEELDPDGIGYEIISYASVDLDGDGAQELILYVEQQGAFYFILHEMDGELYSYCCGVKAMPSIKRDGTVYDNYVYPPEGDGQGTGYSRLSFTRTGLEFHPFTYEVTLPSNEDGLDNDYRLVVDGQPADHQTFEAAIAAQEAKPGVTWYEFPEQAPAPTQPVVPVLDPSSYTFTLDEYGVLVITGLDCESAWWYSKTNCHTPVSGTALGEISISSPGFLGEEFTNTYSSVTAQYSPEGGQLWMSVIENNPGTLGSREFLVDLATGAVTEQEISLAEWKGKLPVPSDQVLAGAAQTLAQLMEAASDFYQASLPAPEEGLLPFDIPMKLMFCSGAGAWDTLITLHPDGSFEGNYHDTDMGVTGPGYQSTEYICRFHGRFGDIRQVTGASWSLTLAELVIDTGHPIGEEWIEAIETSEGSYNLRYISSTPYGFDKVSEGYSIPLEPGAQFMFYTPDASGYRPTDELYGFNSSNQDWDSVIFQFWSWMPNKIGGWGPDTRLGCYALCNMETGYGFFDLKAWGIA